MAGAAIMRGHQVHPDVNLIVIPASRKVYQRVMTEGLLQVFIDAGARVHCKPPGAGLGRRPVASIT